MSEHSEITEAEARRMSEDLCQSWDNDPDRSELCATEVGKGTFGCACYELGVAWRDLMSTTGKSLPFRLLFRLARNRS